MQFFGYGSGFERRKSGRFRKGGEFRFVRRTGRSGTRMDVDVGGLRFGRREFRLRGDFGAQSFEALEFGDGAAVEALGLGLVAKT